MYDYMEDEDFEDDEVDMEEDQDLDNDETAEEYEFTRRLRQAAENFAERVKSAFGVDEVRYAKSLEATQINKHGRKVKRTIMAETTIPTTELFMRLIYTPTAYERINNKQLTNNVDFARMCLDVNFNVYTSLPKALKLNREIMAFTDQKIDKFLGYMPTKDFGDLNSELICMKLKIKNYSERTPDIINEISELLSKEKTRLTMVDFVRALIPVNPYIYNYIYQARYNEHVAKTTAKTKHQINVNDKTRRDLYDVINDAAILKFLNCLPMHGGGNAMHGINPYRIYQKTDYNQGLNVLRYRYEQGVFTETEMLEMNDMEYAAVKDRADKYCATYTTTNEK